MHRVFATKYRRGGFAKAVLEDLQDIFARLCVEVMGIRVEFDGDDERVSRCCAIRYGGAPIEGIQQSIERQQTPS